MASANARRRGMEAINHAVEFGPFTSSERAAASLRILSCFVGLIYRYGGVQPPDEIVVGTRRAASLPDPTDKAGNFDQILALRIPTSDDPTLEELERRVERSIVDAKPSLEQPRFLALIGSSEPQIPVCESIGPSWLESRYGGAIGWQMILDMGWNGDLLRGTFIYDPEVFDRKSAARVGEHLGTLFSSDESVRATPLSRLPLLSERERTLILNLSRGHRAGADCAAAEARLHHLFEAQAAATPDAVAIVGSGGRLSYGELNRRANRLAHTLHTLGVGREVVVGVWMEHRPELVVSLLAILKAEGVCLPLDPDYPDERLRLIVNDARPQVVITCERPRLLTDTTIRILDLEADQHVLEVGDSSNPTPIGFGTLIRETFWPLTTGGTAVLARPGGHRDCGYLTRLMGEKGVTIASVVPSLLRELVEDPGVTRCAALRHVFCTGEALHVDLQLRFFERLPGLSSTVLR